MHNTDTHASVHLNTKIIAFFIKYQFVSSLVYMVKNSDYTKCKALLPTLDSQLHSSNVIFNGLGSTLPQMGAVLIYLIVLLWVFFLVM